MTLQWCFLVSYTNLHKIRSRQPRDLELGGLIAYIQLKNFEILKSQQHEMTSSLCFLNLSIKLVKDNLQH